MLVCLFAGLISSPFFSVGFSCQVIKRANGVKYGLAAVIWSENLSRTHRVSKRLQVQDTN